MESTLPGIHKLEPKNLSKRFAALCRNRNIPGDGEGREITIDIQQTTASLSPVCRDAVQASYAPARRHLCLGRGSPGSRQGSSKSSRGLSSEGAQGLRGFCLRPRPPPEGPQQIHLRTSKEGGLCQDPETLSFCQILRAAS